MADILAGASGVSSKIGRYFTVVSALPSAAFTAYVYVLVRTGAWSGSVSWARAATFQLSDLAVLTVASFVVALALHPLQFAMIQLLEGYWGAAAPARRLAALRIMHHRRRLQSLQDAEVQALLNLAAMPASDQPGSRHATPAALDAALRSVESRRLRASYPPDRARILPTRLGNVLRRYEMTAGAPYGLDIIQALPRLAMVAQPAEVDYLQDQRMQLELAVRTCLLALLASVVTVAFMVRHPPWLLVALIPYVVSYAAYRGAVTVAHEYGAAMSVVAELNRFSLYDRLQLPRPVTLEDEVRQNTDLMKAFAQEANVSFRYVAAPGTAAAAAVTDSAASPAGDSSSDDT
jgi:hypothetical protein